MAIERFYPVGVGSMSSMGNGHYELSSKVSLGVEDPSAQKKSLWKVTSCPSSGSNSTYMIFLMDLFSYSL